MVLTGLAPFSEMSIFPSSFQKNIIGSQAIVLHKHLSAKYPDESQLFSFLNDVSSFQRNTIIFPFLDYLLLIVVNFCLYAIAEARKRQIEWSESVQRDSGGILFELYETEAETAFRTGLCLDQGQVVVKQDNTQDRRQFTNELNAFSLGSVHRYIMPDYLHILHYQVQASQITRSK